MGAGKERARLNAQVERGLQMPKEKRTPLPPKSRRKRRSKRRENQTNNADG
jgi:hypothetical protein